MGKYVDGFVLPVPKDRVEDYRRLAASTNAIRREYGALQCVECVADDVKTGELTSFPQSVTVVFSWIVYESHEHRYRVNEQVMQDPRVAGMDMDSMPFDTRRRIWGGFEVLVNL